MLHMLHEERRKSPVVCPETAKDLACRMADSCAHVQAAAAQKALEAAKQEAEAAAEAAQRKAAAAAESATASAAALAQALAELKARTCST